MNSIGYAPWLNPVTPNSVYCNDCLGAFEKDCYKNEYGGYGSLGGWNNRCDCIIHFYHRSCDSVFGHFWTPHCKYGCADCCDYVCPP